MGARPLSSLLLALIAGFLVSLGIAACGGTQISADEVSAAPPDLTIPTESADSVDALTGSGDAASSDSSSGTSTTSTDGDDTSTSSDSQANDQSTAGGTSTPSSGTGAATPQATATPSNPGGSQAPSTSATPGSGAGTSGTEKFEEFCRQNAGAC